MRSRGRRCTTKFPNQLAFLPSINWYRMSSWLLRLISFALSFDLALQSRCALCGAKDCEAVLTLLPEAPSPHALDCL